MPRTEEANQRIREKRREQILTAATTVFARKGLSEISIADIAATAGISHGLIYRHFASKEEVFAAVIEQALDQARQLAKSSQEQTGTPWERLRWITEKILPGQALGHRPQYFLIILYALTNENIPEQVHRMAVQQGELIHGVIRDLIKEGQQAGQIRPFDPEQLTRLLLSCIQGLVIGKAFRQNNPEEAPSPGADSVLSLLRLPALEEGPF